MLEIPSHRPTWAEINLDNLIHNLQVTKDALGEGVGIMPAVKADAYGHGAVRCALALETAGVQWFGVALPEEGITLREAGVRTPILCLGGYWEGQEDAVVAHRLTPVVFRLSLLERLDRAAKAAGTVVDYHLKVDTGMGRLGVIQSELDSFLDGAARLKSVRLDGVLTHLASADSGDHVEFTQGQIRRFDESLRNVRSRGHRPAWIHQANSAGAHAYPNSRGNLVRLGGVLYGLWRDVTNAAAAPLDWRPVMSLHTRVMLVKTVPPGFALGYGGTFVTARESRIATLPIGYEDGVPRELSNRGQVIVRGRVAPIVGRVSMDLTLIDVTDVEGVSNGDRATIIGSQGGIQLTSEGIAAQIGTISYEVTCRVSDRVPRVYSSA